ncbi:hypothetical protein VUR80DRAFT_5775 [Thermomyces stellatus]
MNTSLCVLGLRAAFNRAPPALLSPTNFASALVRTRAPAVPAHSTRSRPFATTTTHYRKKQKAPFGSLNKAASPPTSDDPIPANPHIDAPAVMIAEPGRGLKGPFPTTKVLRSLDPTTHTLRVVAAGDGNVPICRIFDLRAEAEQRAAREAKEKENERKKNKYKILEVGWGIAENDLAIKMDRMRRFLEDGCRVEVVLLKKKGAKKVDVDGCEGLVGRVRQAISEVGGAKEARPMEGEVGKQVKMFVEKVEKKS